MISLEYIIGQCQEGTTSVALTSQRQRRQNPTVTIIRSGNHFVWEFDGLNVGIVENVPGESRANRIDFYISMEDLKGQLNSFPSSKAKSLGLVDGLRIPVGAERAGGKRIRWHGAISRVNIMNVELKIPPFRMQVNSDFPIILNIDRESSPYPIKSIHGSTTRELHFGIEHPFILKQDSRLSIPRFSFTLDNNQYATVLEAIHKSILIYDAI